MWVPGAQQSVKRVSVLVARCSSCLSYEAHVANDAPVEAEASEQHFGTDANSLAFTVLLEAQRYTQDRFPRQKRRSNPSWFRPESRGDREAAFGPAVQQLRARSA